MLDIPTELEIDASTIICYNAIEAFEKRLLLAGRNKMALGFSTSYTLQKCKGGGIMSDYEMLSLVCVIISLVLIAIDLGRNIGNSNKK